MKNNKGFSLVELIIVIAIMAVLIGVLAPQYLRYVEKSKKQADLSAVGQIFDAAKVACSDPELQKALSDMGSGDKVAKIAIVKDGYTCTSVPTAVVTDIGKTVASTSISLTSNTYSDSTFTVWFNRGTEGFTVERDADWQAVMDAQ